MLKMPSKIYMVGGQRITLTDNDYLSQGGQGVVYRKGNTAYKIYHDISGMIPEAKITELKSLNISNILGPRDVIYDTQSRLAVGFTMPFATNTEFLTRLFNLGFKKTSGLTPKSIVNLVTNMQETLIEIHKRGVIVGDYNEMNFLVSKNWDVVHHIDVDSYQTKSFKCTAIMDSVRDRKVPSGHFDEMTDWFSWAVVTFQLYTGVHPFRGKHPKYSQSDFDGRMKDNISVFNPDVTLPKMFGDWSVIPTAHLEWYKRIFEQGERSIPPTADGKNIATGWKVLQVATGKGIIIDLIRDYGEEIFSVNYFDGDRWVLTNKSIWKGDRKITDIQSDVNNIRICKIFGLPDVAVAIKNHDKVTFYTINRIEIGFLYADDWMCSDGIIYTSYLGKLQRCNIEKLAHIRLMPSHAANVVSNASKMFDGVVIQSIYGKALLTIPYNNNAVANIYVTQLNGLRVVDSARKGRWMIAIVEMKGKYNRITLHFNNEFTKYDISIEDDVSEFSVNFCVRQNGLMLQIIDGDTLRVMGDLKGNGKEIQSTSLTIDTILYDGLDKILFSNGNKLNKMSMS